MDQRKYATLVVLVIFIMIVFTLIAMAHESYDEGVKVVISLIALLLLIVATYYRFRDAGKGKVFSIVCSLLSWTVIIIVYGAIIPSKKLKEELCQEYQ